MFSVYMYMVMFFRIIFRQQRSHQAVQRTTSLAMCLQLYRCYRPLWFTSPPVRLYDQLYLTSFTLALILFQASKYLNITWTLDSAKDHIVAKLSDFRFKASYQIIVEHKVCLLRDFQINADFSSEKEYSIKEYCTILHIVCNWCMQIGV